MNMFLPLSAVFILFGLSMAQMDLYDDWTAQMDNMSLAQDLPQEEIDKLRNCPICQNMDVRQNHYTVDGNFYSEYAFSDIKAFFHEWMTVDTVLHEVFIDTENQFHANYYLATYDQKISLFLEGINSFYRFEADARARDEMYFEQQQEYLQTGLDYF